MSLYGLSALVLLLGTVLTALVFLSYRKRLAELTVESDVTEMSLQQMFTSTPLERGLGYALVALIGYLIWQTITQGFDFALLMIGATGFTGFVYLLDYRLSRKTRLAILERASVQIPEFEETVDTATLEPGLIENSRAFFPILVFVFVLRSFLLEPFQIPSGSMKPTLEISDFILVNRFVYGIRMPISNKVIIPIGTPRQGDVIVFKPPHEPDKNFIKRVIGVPGDLIQYDYSRKILRVNGEVVPKDLIEKRTDEAGRYNLYSENLFGREHQIYNNQSRAIRRPDEWLPINGVTVPEGKYFVMGDNRDNSQDARYWEGTRRLQTGDFSNNGNNAWGFVDEDSILGQAFVIWMHWQGFYPSFARTGFIQ